MMRIFYLALALFGVGLGATLSSVVAEETPADGSTVTLKANDVPLMEVFQTVEKQTGNRVVDLRQVEEGATPQQQLVKINFQKEPFWSAIDKLLDAARLSLNNDSGEVGLALVDRPKGERKRYGSAAYGGPFRMEVLEVQSQQNLRRPEEKSLKLQLEVAWEPRLQPIAVSQPALDVSATADEAKILLGLYPDAVYSAEIPQATQSTEIVLPFELPPRGVAKITSLKGKLRAVLPTKHVKFEFADLEHAAGKSQKQEDVEVVIDSVKKNNEIWELHMRLRLDKASHALETYRSWAFENASYLVDAKGETFENAGLETTSQSENEVGVAYFFDATEGLDGMKWIYESPAAIVDVPIDYELKDIELP
jgi:hypothetical protein